MEGLPSPQSYTAKCSAFKFFSTTHKEKRQLFPIIDNLVTEV